MIRIQTEEFSGRIQAIPSKSYAHRALICAALAENPSFIGIDRSSIDIDTTASALQALGTRIQRDANGFLVEPGDKPRGRPVLDCMESGSTLRFLLPVAAARFPTVDFIGRGRLPRRPLSDLAKEMEKKGSVFSSYQLPLTVTGRLKGGRYTLPGDVSSQYVTGLLLAAPLLGGIAIELTSALESEDYVNITLDVMKAFGVQGIATDGGYQVPKGQAYMASDYKVEGDWSNAGFFLVAGALSGGIRYQGLNPHSRQGDRGILSVLDSFGARVETGDEIRVVPVNRRPFHLDLRRMPDALPALAVLAAGARGDSVFTGGKRLRLKESDRLQTTVAMLKNLGGQATETEDGIIVHGTGSLRGGTTPSYGDHRIAMAAAVASVLCTDPVQITEADAVNKSYPDFFSDVEKIGGRIV